MIAFPDEKLQHPGFLRARRDGGINPWSVVYWGRDRYARWLRKSLETVGREFVDNSCKWKA